MGSGESKYASESEISDDDLDVSFMFSGTPMGTREPNTSNLISNNTLDAVRRLPLPSIHDLLSFKKLLEIEEQLVDFEIISLIYLLYESCERALMVLNAFKNPNKNQELLYNWVLSEGIDDKKKQKRLIEALCIVQNYQILENLGYDKHELQLEYMPCRVEISIAVPKVRKILYLVAETLNKTQTSKFIKKMQEMLSENNIALPKYDQNYLEFYFLYWEYSQISINDIQKVLKTIGLEAISNHLDYAFSPEGTSMPENTSLSLKLKEIKPKPNGNLNKTSTTKDNTYLQMPLNQDVSSNQAATSGISEENSFLGLNKYPIDQNNPGVVLIINQESFFTETEDKYKHLLHENKDEIQLSSRHGTEVDRDRLHNIFTQMGYKVIVRDNLEHYRVLKMIESVTDSISQESSLIICILSHGDEGVVYGSNSCKVKVREIEYIMCKRNKKLIGKPKVLILQACQGERCQNIIEEDTDDEGRSNTTDGPSRVAPIADLLSFWATIPGYAAIRNMRKGSWFIQALCDEIENGSTKFHFADICTKVMNKVTKKEWKEDLITNVMTPIMESTLTQSFFLPPFKSSYHMTST